ITFNLNWCDLLVDSDQAGSTRFRLQKNFNLMCRLKLARFWVFFNLYLLVSFQPELPPQSYIHLHQGLLKSHECIYNSITICYTAFRAVHDGLPKTSQARKMVARTENRATCCKVVS